MAPCFLKYEEKKALWVYFPEITSAGDWQLPCPHPSGKQNLADLLFTSK